MNRTHLFHLFKQAKQLTGHHDYVIIGSLSILGLADEDQISPDMTMSNDIDAYTKADPARIFDLQHPLGEGSVFHVDQGYFLDPVSDRLASLPDGWEQRMTWLEQDSVRLWFPEANDAAVSKYARGNPNDMRWIRAGLKTGLLSLPTIRQRMNTTVFADTEEEARAKQLAEADRQWLEAQR